MVESASMSKIYSMLVFTAKWVYRAKKYCAVFSMSPNSDYMAPRSMLMVIS
jgi:hypothetical protein